MSEADDLPGNVGFCICLPDLCLRRLSEYPGEGKRLCRACWGDGPCLLTHAGATAICRTCRESITFETVSEPGRLDRTAWSDGSRADPLVCFRAVHYRHVPDWVPDKEARE